MNRTKRLLGLALVVAVVLSLMSPMMSVTADSTGELTREELLAGYTPLPNGLQTPAEDLIITRIEYGATQKPHHDNPNQMVSFESCLWVEGTFGPNVTNVFGAQSYWSVYLPSPELFEGRFYHRVYPFNTGTITDDVIFAFASGAYVMEYYEIGEQFYSATAVNIGRTIAANYYGLDVDGARTSGNDDYIYGYAYGGSGGSPAAIQVMEDDKFNVWDGSITYVITAPDYDYSGSDARTAFRNLMLRGTTSGNIWDAMRVGGSGDPYAGYTPLQVEAIKELELLGVRWQDMSVANSFTSNLSVPQAYINDFFTEGAGFTGTEDSPIGAYFREIRGTTIGTTVMTDALLARLAWHRHKNYDPKLGMVWYDQFDHLAKAGPLVTFDWYSGDIKRPGMIIQNMQDGGAPYNSAEWYTQHVEAQGKGHLFRTYITEGAGHTDALNSSGGDVPYLGILEQALRDLAAWVEDGVAPPESTGYDVRNNQVYLKYEDGQRKGIQPFINLYAEGGRRADARPRSPVTLEARIEPAVAGDVITEVAFNSATSGGTWVVIPSSEWDVDADGSVTVSRTVSYTSTGTNYPRFRATAYRGGLPVGSARDQLVGRLMTATSVRVVVRNDAPPTRTELLAGYIPHTALLQTPANELIITSIEYVDSIRHHENGSARPIPPCLKITGNFGQTPLFQLFNPETGREDYNIADWSIYLPAKELFEGRFYQRVYPFNTGNLPADVEFAFSSGAYQVEYYQLNNLFYNASIAHISRTIAANYYGLDPADAVNPASDDYIYGYAYGGSGGSGPTIEILEHEEFDVWDGGITYVMTAPTTLAFAMGTGGDPIDAFAAVALRHRGAQIWDAVRPGGSGDPYAGLEDWEREVLEEIERYGMMWSSWSSITASSNPFTMWALGALFGIEFGPVIPNEAEYLAKFWTEPGYLGTEQSPLGDRWRQLRDAGTFSANNLAKAAWHRHRNVDPELNVFTFDHLTQYPKHGPLITSDSYTGNIQRKGMVIQSMEDGGAIHWYADWYHQRVVDAGKGDDFRIYLTESAGHDDGPTAGADSVPYLGILEQALRDLAAWVEDDVPPAVSTGYDRVRSQPVLRTTAAGRQGYQPVINFTVNGGTRTDVRPGRPVNFEARIQAPPMGGEIIRVEWNVSGSTYVNAPFTIESDGSVTVQTTHTYTSTGTNFPRVRVTAHRDGRIDTRIATLQNLSSARVVVSNTAPVPIITFDANGGTGTIPPASVTGATFTIPGGTGFTRANHAFAGWNTLANGTGERYLTDQAYAFEDSITLFAQWTRTAVGIGPGPIILPNW